jgi:hypothetical protein
MKLNDRELNEMVAAMQTKPKWDYSGSFDLQPPDDYESDEDSLGDQTTNDSIEIEIVDECEDECEDDGQPTEYEEWQDFNGGDDWDQGQYDCMDY